MTASSPDHRASEILQAWDLSKVYTVGGTSLEVLKGLSLGVVAGEFLAIMGPSGSGKSTLLHLLGGLDRPTSGRVQIEGREISRLSDKEVTLYRRERTGFVFQFFNLIPTLNAVENIALPLMITGHTSPERQERVGDLIQLFGLRGRERHRPSELSAGEQQRVALARAFLMEPAIVIADEPTGNLDTVTSREILQLLWESCDNFGQTILLVTHDPQAASYADRVLFLVDGQLVDELNLGRREDHSDSRLILNRLQELSL